MLTLPAELRASDTTEREWEATETAGVTLLSIDTSIGTSIALGHSGRVFEASSDDSRGHAEVIGGLIARVFAQADVSPRAVTGVVAGVGPGPFTGLRVGIAAAHAFAAGLAVPVLPLLGHEAVALALLENGATSPELGVVQDARRRELFVTDYSGLDWSGVPVRVTAPRLMARDGFVECHSDAWPERIPAGRLVQLAARKLASGASFESDQAVYLRAPDAKPAAAVKRVSA